MLLLPFSVSVGFGVICQHTLVPEQTRHPVEDAVADLVLGQQGEFFDVHIAVNEGDAVGVCAESAALTGDVVGQR